MDLVKKLSITKRFRKGCVTPSFLFYPSLLLDTVSSYPSFPLRSDLSKSPRPPFHHASITTSILERDYNSLDSGSSVYDPDSNHRYPRRSRSMPLDFLSLPSSPKPRKLTKKSSGSSIHSRVGSESRPKRKEPPPLYKEALRHPGLLVSAQPNVTRALRYAYDSPESDLSDGEGDDRVSAGRNRSNTMSDMGVLVYKVSGHAVGLSGNGAPIMVQGMHPIKRDAGAVLHRSASFSQPTRHAYPHLHQTVQRQNKDMPSPRPSATPFGGAHPRAITSPTLAPSHSRSQNPSSSPTSSHRSPLSQSLPKPAMQRSSSRPPPPPPPSGPLPPLPLANLSHKSSTATLRASTSTSTLRVSSSSTLRDRPDKSRHRHGRLYLAGVCLDDFPTPPTHLSATSSASHVRESSNSLYGQTITQKGQTTVTPLPPGARPSAFVQRSQERLALF